MGAVPKRRISKGRQGRRRGAIKIKALTMVDCSNCSQKKRPHQACSSCGYYKGKQIVVKKEKKSKKKE
ncbi:50S ribosomal protein L32 [Candidatus Microgenomates bacterium]|nr:50S ribosomal protein L32 [Candidatus Microgenomates bacterium]